MRTPVHYGQITKVYRLSVVDRFYCTAMDISIGTLVDFSYFQRQRSNNTIYYTRDRFKTFLLELLSIPQNDIDVFGRKRNMLRIN